MAKQEDLLLHEDGWAISGGPVWKNASETIVLFKTCEDADAYMEAMERRPNWKYWRVLGRFRYNEPKPMYPYVIFKRGEFVKDHPAWQGEKCEKDRIALLKPKKKHVVQKRKADNT